MRRRRATRQAMRHVGRPRGHLALPPLRGKGNWLTSAPQRQAPTSKLIKVLKYRSEPSLFACTARAISLAWLGQASIRSAALKVRVIGLSSGRAAEVCGEQGDVFGACAATAANELGAMAGPGERLGEVLLRGQAGEHPVRRRPLAGLGV